MRICLLVLAIAFTAGAAQAPAPSRPPAPPATDIYLLALPGGIATMQAAKPWGYDNQPMFSPDGARLLFAANRDGKQIDIDEFERASGKVAQLTETPTNENSPTYLPAGLGSAGDFSVVRTEADIG